MKQRRINPYCELNQHASHLDWQRGHRDRAAKPPGAYLEILDADAMRVE